MKKFLKGIILLLSGLALTSLSACSGGTESEKPDGSVSMIATVRELGEKIEVDVVESQYTSGIYWVITSDATEFVDEEGKKIAKNDLKVGDTVEILYSGQVMMSYPPQIVAAKISIMN